MMKKNKQKGFALVTAILISALVLMIGSIVVYKFSTSSQQINRDKKVRKAVSLAEEGMSSFIDYVSNVQGDAITQFNALDNATPDQMAAAINLKNAMFNMDPENGDTLLDAILTKPNHDDYQKVKDAFQAIGECVSDNCPNFQFVKDNFI